MALARTFFVRKLVPADKAAYDLKPEDYAGEWKSDPKGAHGEVVSENFLPVQDGENIRNVPMLGVMWEDRRTPAIIYEDPAFLENVDYLYANEEEEEEEPEEDEKN